MEAQGWSFNRAPTSVGGCPPKPYTGSGCGCPDDPYIKGGCSNASNYCKMASVPVATVSLFWLNGGGGLRERVGLVVAALQQLSLTDVLLGCAVRY